MELDLKRTVLSHHLGRLQNRELHSSSATSVEFISKSARVYVDKMAALFFCQATPSDE